MTRKVVRRLFDDSDQQQRPQRACKKQRQDVLESPDFSETRKVNIPLAVVFIQEQFLDHEFVSYIKQRAPRHNQQVHRQRIATPIVCENSKGKLDVHQNISGWMGGLPKPTYKINYSVDNHRTYTQQDVLPTNGHSFDMDFSVIEALPYTITNLHITLDNALLHRPLWMTFVSSEIVHAFMELQRRRLYPPEAMQLQNQIEEHQVQELCHMMSITGYVEGLEYLHKRFPTTIDYSCVLDYAVDSGWGNVLTLALGDWKLELPESLREKILNNNNEQSMFRLILSEWINSTNPIILLQKPTLISCIE